MKKQLQQLSMICTFLILSGINLYSFPFQETAAQDNGRKMNFQGTLYENGEPVNGDRSMTFSIELDEETWTETQTVQIIEGLYSVVLGSVTPLPSNLFFGVEERAITVSVGSNTLGTVPLYAPFALNDNKNFGKGEFKLDSKEPEDSVALNAEIFGVGTDIYNMAVRGLARTESTNTGVAGIATGSLDNARFQTGVIGNAFSNNIDAWATGTWGTGYSYSGGVTYGMRGEVYGNGATFSAAARALNHMEPGQDGVRYGGFFDTRVGAAPYSGRSIGVQGTARGSIENIGVFGAANGPEGTTNWAGWFEGNVSLRNGSDLTIYNANNQLRLDLNFFEDNDAGSLVTYGHNNTRRSILGSSSDRSGGLLNLYDSLDRSAVQIRATSRTESWVTDDNPHGQLKLFGPNSQNIAFGARVWEAGGADRPTFQMFGTRLDDPNNPGNLVDSEMIFMSVQDNGDGEQGLLQFGKAGAGNVILNYDNVIQLLNNSGGLNLGYNSNENGLLFNLGAHTEANDKGILELFGTRQVDDGNGGQYTPPLAQLVAEYDNGDDLEYGVLRLSDQSGLMKARLRAQGSGDLRLYGANSNEILRLRARGDGNYGQAEFFSADGSTKSEIGVFGDNSGFAQFFGPNGAKNIQMGGSDANRDLAMFRMSGSSENNLINLEIAKDDADTQYATLVVRNTSGGGFETGSRSWENNNQGGNLSYAALKGIQDVSDGNGGTYRPWLVSQEVLIDNNGQEYGALNLSSVNGSISLNGTGDANFSGNVNVSSLNQTSDARLKKNISTLTSGLTTINRLRGVRYNWKDESKPENKIGFIAQEVEEILPELVHTKADGFKAVNYAEMTAVLVEAVKELTQQIEDLKKENTSLKAELSTVKDMEDRLAKIEALLGSSEKRTQSTDKK